VDRWGDRTGGRHDSFLPERADPSVVTESPSHPLFAALYDPVMESTERVLFPPHREYLVDGLAGDVLDLGSGTGAMLPYYAEPVRSGAATVTLLEPDPHMRRRAVARADDLAVDVRFSDASAERLPFPDDSFDAVVAAIVFCTIPDPAAALDEAARVLRPGGEFRYLEHVADRGWRRGLQAVVAPLWRRAAGGCHVQRRTGEQFAAHGAFETVESERFDLGAGPVRPFVRGTLRRRDR
jgi:SAM-dependent methyltransferase